MAISFIESALKISPNYSNAIIELSSLMIQKQDYQQAATLLSRFNKLSKPTSLSLYTGYLISKQKGQLNESKRLRILLKNLANQPIKRIEPQVKRIVKWKPKKNSLNKIVKSCIKWEKKIK